MDSNVDLIFDIKRKLISKYSRFSSNVANCNIEYRRDLKYHTAATDGKNIYIDPDYFASLDEDDKLFIIAHEIMHIKFLHMYRLIDRNKDKRDLDLWNEATDAIINANLERDGFKIKKGWVNMPEALDYSAEEFYQILKERQKDKQNQEKEQGNEQEQEQGKEQGNEQEQEQEKEQGNEQEQEQGKEQGNEQEQEQEKEQGNEQGQEQGKEQGNEQSNEQKQSQEENKEKQQGDDHSLWEEAFENQQQEAKKAKKQSKQEEKSEQPELSKNQIEDEIEQTFDERNEFENNRKEKREKFKRNSEKTKESIRSNNEKIELENIGNSSQEIDWKTMVRREVEKSETIWSNRRSIAENNYDYRLEEYDVEDEAETEVMIDVSGSVSLELVRAFLRQLKPLLKQSKLRVACFNEQFWGFVNIKNVKDIDNFTIPQQARGSSAWTEDWDLAVRSFTKKREINKIVFTDGYPCPGTMPKEDLKRENIIWLVYGNKDFKPCCGKIIHITEKQLERLKQIDEDVHLKDKIR